MRIGELARRTECDIETIRFYERKALLDRPAREPNGYRTYDEAHLRRLSFIRHCRSLGMGLPDIRLLCAYQQTPEQGCDRVNRLIDEHIVRIHQQIETLHRLEEQLHALRNTCSGAEQSTADCAILRNLQHAPHGGTCICHSNPCPARPEN
ncbi:Cd(II)/Pb(II)-responsive transcriptional regulator [Propionivibrio limicola]|uniref:Cd(II)/Pb(II)-responsive transcriptional regulator n=1 Tax=Propionivibrio limicola TaxID=167645 RepID=UPI00129172AE|nr:Cd(II)/Pb(II)-responsive transcriptional regulator [Propionivibrio limicola]